MEYLWIVAPIEYHSAIVNTDAQILASAIFLSGVERPDPNAHFDIVFLVAKNAIIVALREGL